MKRGSALKITNDEYKRVYQKASPKSPIIKDVIMAFLVGGTICTIAQLIKNYLATLGLSEADVSSALSIILVFIGVLLTDLHLYQKLAKFGGAGTVVPITGFANSIAAPAVEYKTEGLVMGTCVKMFTIAGPVLVCGITASIVYGLIYYFML